MNANEGSTGIPLRTALLVGLCGTLLAGLIPAALTLDRRLSAELERRAREELLRAPMVLKDRNEARAEALAMHADVVAAAPGLADAIRSGDRDAALTIASAAAAFPGEEPVLVSLDGDVWIGPPGASTVAAGGGAAGVTFVSADDGPYAVSLAAVPAGAGASAGVAAPVDAAAAATVSALTRSDVVIFTADGAVSAATLDSASAAQLALRSRDWDTADVVHVIDLNGGRYWAVLAPLGTAGIVALVRSVDAEFAVIPGILRAAALAVLVALLLAIAAGALFAVAVTRPVRQLAAAASQLAEGDFDAPVPRSAIREVRQVAGAFESMRASLAERLKDLGTANRALQERQQRLEALQTELIQQDRLVASGRLVAELAHEIRNPVANVRNCIEVVRRRLNHDPEARAFADMAVDELLRMHRLAEQLLDLHRPSETGDSTCDVPAIMHELAALSRIRDGGAIHVHAPDVLRVAMPRDALMQVLMNLVENAREASGGGHTTLQLRCDDGVAYLEVLDDGVGIPDEVLTRMFDPFFTTKGAVSGVGLGLFVASGIVRRYGGRLRAENRNEGGARMTLELLVANEEATS